jgi:hypothetical protein
MRRKGERHVPDFSSHPKGAPVPPPHGVAPEPRLSKAPHPAARGQVVKPHATSAKSGRRGQ